MELTRTNFASSLNLMKTNKLEVYCGEQMIDFEYLLVCFMEGPDEYDFFD